MKLIVLLAATMLLCAPANAQGGPIAHYTLSQGRGDVLKDQSGHGHDGRIIGADWVRDRGAGALRFTGKNSYVDLGEHRGLKVDASQCGVNDRSRHAKACSLT